MIPQSAVPIRLIRREGEIGVDWLRLTASNMSEPFFFQTVKRLREAGERYVFTGADELTAFAERSHDVKTAFIFHVSHCGSTLLANALKTVANAVVISEPALMTPGQLLSPSARKAFGRSTLEALILGAVNAYALNGPPKRYVFFKFMDLASLALPTLRRMFPAVPFVFIYREPSHVIASNLEEVPEDLRLSAAPDIKALLGKDQAWEPSATAWWSAIYEAECLRAAVAPNTVMVDYCDLNDTRAVQLMCHLGMNSGDIDKAAVSTTFGRYSKASPTQNMTFSPAADYERRRTTAERMDPGEYLPASAAYRRLRAMKARIA